MRSAIPSTVRRGTCWRSAASRVRRCCRVTRFSRTCRLIQPTSSLTRGPSEPSGIRIQESGIRHGLVIRVRTRESALPGDAKRALDLGDARLVALVERPLFDPLGADKPGVGEDAKVLARRRLAHAQLLRNEQAADAVLHEIAIPLSREMRRRR